MTYIQSFIVTWIAIWLLCSVGYILSSLLKPRKEGLSWSLKENLPQVIMLFIAWPFALVIYFWAGIKFHKSESEKE